MQFNEAEAVQLDDIVVTATKREKSLREIPASIGAFNGARLEDEAKFNLADFIEQKPGVTMTTLGPPSVRVNIRGVGSDAYAGAPLPSPTGMLIGDTAFGESLHCQHPAGPVRLRPVERPVVPAGSWMPGVARYQYLAAINYTSPPISIFEIGGRSAPRSGRSASLPLLSRRLAQAPDI